MFEPKTVGSGLLALVLMVSLFLNSYGASFGLPYRWNVDETLAAALRVGAERSLIWGDINQTHFHTYLVTLLLVPYVLYVKLTSSDFSAMQEAVAVSWNHFATVAPDFAANLYRVARFLSALIGTATVFIVYRLGTVLWGTRVGLMAAALLALTQGFVGSNHFVRSEPLVNFFGAFVLYLLVRSFEKGPHRYRYFLLGAFFAGLALATKYNGMVLVGSVGLAWLWLTWDAFRQAPRSVPLALRVVRAVKLPWLLAAATLYIAGLLIGQPTLLEMLVRYREVTDYWRSFFNSRATPTVYAANVINYLIQLVVIYGIPFGAFVVAGIAIFMVRARRSATAAGAGLVLATAAAYFLVPSVYPFPQLIKFIIFIVPLLAVFGGLALSEVSVSPRIPALVRVVALTLVFGYSFVYAFSVDLLLARDDVRYESTRWIEANIPAGASIEHIQEEAWLYSARIIPSYDIIYFGRHSGTYRGSLFKREPSEVWRKTKHDYLALLLSSEPQADYFILWIEDLAELRGSRNSANLQDRFFDLMLSEQLGYRLVHRIQSRNYRIPMERFPRIYYPRSFWWNPTIDYTPAEIRIYRRVGPVTSGGA